MIAGQAVTALSIVLILVGVFFHFASAIGILRMPDFYTRCHAAGVMDTLGALLILGGIVLYIGWQLVVVKIVLIFVFLSIVNPTVCHALQRAALRSGLKPWPERRGGAE
ncbi:MAG: monovalent cation/H(+) antiporter subunit G [Vicinamibacteria bacterium]|nr:monovalent cation/H(+) antiporter subunit G [Vicinamibacteria bacterium]